MNAKDRRKRTTEIIRDLTAIIERIGVHEVPSSVHAQNTLRRALQAELERLEEAAERLDPILRPIGLFDPSDPQTAGRVIALTAVAQPRHPLGLVRPFYGAGVYAVYYIGDFKPYHPLSRTEQPIYVGKADPKDRRAKNSIGQGTSLSARLSEHARSINRADSTLSLDHFECRFLIVQSGYQRAAEEYLINFFRPIWNNEVDICFGIGKHGDNAKTRSNKRSPWDTLHPGRPWATGQVEDQKPRQRIVAEITSHLQQYPPHENLEEILSTFMAELRQFAPTNFESPTEPNADIEAGNVDNSSLQLTLDDLQ